MIEHNKIVKFVQSQKSLHLYKKAQQAFVDVLSNLSDDEYNIVTDNLIIMAIHDGVTGQVMHFPPNASKFTVMQLTIKKDMPISVLRRVVAHELGHVMQGRNWQESDGFSLEENADKWAEKWGFPFTPEVEKWQKDHYYSYYEKN
jgi:hypothetical protein